MTDVITDARDGVQSFGVLNTNTGGDITIDRSSLKGVTNSISNDNNKAKVNVGGSKLEGTAREIMKCVWCYNGTCDQLSGSCQ